MKIIHEKNDDKEYVKFTKSKENYEMRLEYSLIEAVKY